MIVELHDSQLFPLLFEATAESAGAAPLVPAAGAAPFTAGVASAVDDVVAAAAAVVVAAAVAAAACSFSFSRFFSGGRVGQSSMRWSAPLQLWQRLGMGACGHLDARWFAKSPQLQHLRGSEIGCGIRRKLLSAITTRE